jgi:hypothetical protein
MRSSLSLTAAIAVFISSTAALQWPDLSLLLKREDVTPGSPLYNCHEACGKSSTSRNEKLTPHFRNTTLTHPKTGEVILISESGNYCSNSTFTTDLNACLECALTYNIWQYYGDHVKSAATSCSEDATPSSSSATSGAAATVTAPTTATTTGNSSVVTSASSTSAATSTVCCFYTL